jgi:uncharacterized Zn finger protein
MAAKQAKKERRELAPVCATGRKLTKNFWGQAWCDNLEQYSDYANRLPRGRRYLGNGSVVDLQIKNALIAAIVAGSEVYQVKIAIKTLAKKKWQSLQRECAQSIHSLMDLLQGRFDDGVMQRLLHPKNGLFPKPDEIEMDCSCPDSAGVCKHVAAVMYGVGVRLDAVPELLFTLRNVDHTELITQAIAAENLERTLVSESSAFATEDLGELFGIDLESKAGAASIASAKLPRAQRPRRAKVNSSIDLQYTHSTKGANSSRKARAGEKPTAKKKKRGAK